MPRLVETLSRRQQNVLVEHVAGPRPIVRSFGKSSDRKRSVESLVRLGFLAYDAQSARGSRRPRFSRLTEAGREAVCAVLADYADALVSAGVLPEAPPIAPAFRKSRELISA